MRASHSTAGGSAAALAGCDRAARPRASRIERGTSARLRRPYRAGARRRGAIPQARYLLRVVDRTAILPRAARCLYDRRAEPARTGAVLVTRARRDGGRALITAAAELAAGHPLGALKQVA